MSDERSTSTSADGGQAPIRRTDGLVVHAVGDEVVVHDPATAQTHALGADAAAVFNAIDGHRDLDGVADNVAVRAGSPATVGDTVVELSATGLVQPTGSRRLERRDALRLGGAAAFAAPLIYSVAAAPVAAAQSDDGGGATTGGGTGGTTDGGVATTTTLPPPPQGNVTTLAGSTQGSTDGTGTNAQFNGPFGVAVAPDGTIYVADTDNNRIRAITPAGVVTTLAGSTFGDADGTGTNAKFNDPYGVAVAPDGTIYVADTNNHRIRAIT